MEKMNEKYSELLGSTRAPHWLGILGYSIVLVAFVVAVINALLPESNPFVARILMPFIFVGIASLLYHIGQHVHALHQNALRMIAMQSNGSERAQGGSAQGETRN
ncbi:MAG: hypothetical protein ACE5M4_06920 [Anaerolineales bacterium]